MNKPAMTQNERQRLKALKRRLSALLDAVDHEADLLASKAGTGNLNAAAIALGDGLAKLASVANERLPFGNAVAAKEVYGETNGLRVRGEFEANYGERRPERQRARAAN